MRRNGQSSHNVPFIFKSEHPIAIALRALNPHGSRLTTIGIFEGRVAWQTIRGWVHGRRRPPAWAYETVTRKITDMLANAPRGVEPSERSAIMRRNVLAYRIKRARKLDELQKEKGAP